MTNQRVSEALAWYGIDALGPVWDELARRMGASERPVRTLKVAELDDAGRRALASLFGSPRVPHQAPLSISTAKLADGLGVDDDGLRAVVERLRGPLENRSAARRASKRARESLWETADERLGSRIPQTLAKIRARGVPGGEVEAHAQMLERLALTLDRLPLREPLPVPMLAWELFGDPHALDPGARCGRHLGAAAWELARPRDADGSTRRAMAALKVVADRLSTTTLTYGLRARTDSVLGQLLETAAAASLPLNISGAMLDAGPTTFIQPRWWCVENPSVVEACTLAGIQLPIVCTSGWPSRDTQLLLELAVQQGIELVYAGDYDREGLILANWMAIQFSAVISMSADTYLLADHERAPEWSGSIPATPWEEELRHAIEAKNRVVYQEDPAVWRRFVGAVTPASAR